MKSKEKESRTIQVFLTGSDSAEITEQLHSIEESEMHGLIDIQTVEDSGKIYRTLIPLTQIRMIRIFDTDSE